MVTSTWSGPTGELGSTSRITVSNTAIITSQLYHSNLTISQLNPLLDSGSYSCNSTVLPLSPFLTESEAAATTTVTVEGM